MMTPTTGPQIGGTQVTTVTLGLFACISPVASPDGRSITCSTPSTDAPAFDLDIGVGASQTGSVTRRFVFTYNLLPEIFPGGVQPTSGLQTGGTPFSITGQGFAGHLTVLVGRNAATGVNTDDMQRTITAVLPASATTGTTDVTVISSTAGTVAVTGVNGFNYVRAPSAAFACPLTTPAGASPQSVVVTDFNGDGILDVATADASRGGGGVLLGTAGPTSASFGVPFTFPTGAFAAHVAVGDINRDGLPDWIVSNSDASTVSVLLNTTPSLNATPTFAPPVNLVTPGGPAGLAIADLTGDATPDIVVACRIANTVSIFLNTTPATTFPATFAAPIAFAAGSFTQGLALADLNGDGKDDVAFLLPDGLILLNQSSP